MERFNKLLSLLLTAALLCCLLPTAAFAASGTKSDPIPLKAGENTVKFLSTVANQGGPNFDYINQRLTDEPVAEPYDPNAHQETVDTS